MKDGREVCIDTPMGRQVYKFRTNIMAERQKWKCALCGLLMTEETVSFDHEDGRGHGGALRDDRVEVDGVRINAAVHVLCNAKKGSQRVPYLLQ